MADRFWKSVPAAFRKPALDELYKRLRYLDYTQLDERLAVMLNAILQLEAQGECMESATEAVLMAGYTSDGISNQEQTRCLSWNVDGGVRSFDLARNLGLSTLWSMARGSVPFQPDHQQGQGPNPPANHHRCCGHNKRKSHIRSQQHEKRV